MKKIKQLYQGDVSIIKGISELPENLEFILLPKNGLTVALGEVSGHHHTIIAEKGAVISYAEYLNEWYLKIDKGSATITHQEHAPITMLPGIYFVGKQWEFDDLEEYKQVRD